MRWVRDQVPEGTRSLPLKPSAESCIPFFCPLDSRRVIESDASWDRVLRLERKRLPVA